MKTPLFHQAGDSRAACRWQPEGQASREPAWQQLLNFIAIWRASMGEERHFWGEWGRSLKRLRLHSIFQQVG